MADAVCYEAKPVRKVFHETVSGSASYRSDCHVKGFTEFQAVCKVLLQRKTGLWLVNIAHNSALPSPEQESVQNRAMTLVEASKNPWQLSNSKERATPTLITVCKQHPMTDAWEGMISLLAALKSRD